MLSDELRVIFLSSAAIMPCSRAAGDPGGAEIELTHSFCSLCKKLAHEIQPTPPGVTYVKHSEIQKNSFWGTSSQSPMWKSAGQQNSHHFFNKRSPSRSPSALWVNHLRLHGGWMDPRPARTLIICWWIQWDWREKVKEEHKVHSYDSPLTSFMLP